MPEHLSRRAFLAGCATIGATVGMPTSPAWAETQQRRLIVGRRTIEVLGKAAEVYGVTSASGGRGVVLEPVNASAWRWRTP